MKKILVVPFLLVVHLAIAGTGGARDTEFLYLVVIAFLALILAVLYSIGFVKKLVKDRKQRRIVPTGGFAEGSNPGDSIL